MYTAYMKNTSTAWNYAKGLRHLMPKNFDWKDAGVDVRRKMIFKIWQDKCYHGKPFLQTVVLCNLTYS